MSTAVQRSPATQPVATDARRLPVIGLRGSRSPRSAPGRLPTPAVLGLALGGVGVALVVLWACVASSVASTRQSIQAVGRDSIPSILVAEEIRLSLARAHAAAADGWLAQGLERARRFAEHERALDEAADRLVAAAQNVTYGEEERAPIVALARTTRRYAALVAAARICPAPTDVEALAGAARILHRDLLPAADLLAGTNLRHLEHAYESAREHAESDLARVILGTFVAFAALLGLSVVIARRFRRLVSLPVLAAAGVVAILAVCSLSALEEARDALRCAKADAFDSAHALARARALLLDASAEESLSLTVPGTEGERAFRATVDAIALEPTADRSAARRVHESGIRGLLGDELRNVTFPGEHAAATQALGSFRAFLALDARLRALEAKGQHAEAVALRLDGASGIAGTLERTEADFARVEEINTRELERAIGRAFAALGSMPTLAVLAPLGAFALAGLGVRPRLREYAA